MASTIFSTAKFSRTKPAGLPSFSRNEASPASCSRRFFKAGQIAGRNQKTGLAVETNLARAVAIVGHDRLAGGERLRQARGRPSRNDRCTSTSMMPTSGGLRLAERGR